MTFTGNPIRDEIIGELERGTIATERALQKRMAENPSEIAQRGRADEAIACVREHSPLLADPEIEADCLASIGEIASMAGEYQAAMGHFAEALELKPLGKILQYRIVDGLGHCLVELDRFNLNPAVGN